MGEELGGGLEVGAGRAAGLRVRAVLLRGGGPQYPLGKVSAGLGGEPVLDPFGVCGGCGRVEAEQLALDVHSGLAVALELGADGGVVEVGVEVGHLGAGVAQQALDDVLGDTLVINRVPSVCRSW